MRPAQACLTSMCLLNLHSAHWQSYLFYRTWSSYRIFIKRDLIHYTLTCILLWIDFSFITLYVNDLLLESDDSQETDVIARALSDSFKMINLIISRNCELSMKLHQANFIES